MKGEEKTPLWCINGLPHHDGLEAPPGLPTAFIYLVILSLHVYVFLHCNKLLCYRCVSDRCFSAL